MRHLNQVRPKHTKDVTLEIYEEMPMKALYDVFDIPVPLIPLNAGRISLSKPTKLVVSHESIREKKKVKRLSPDPLKMLSRI